MGTFFSFMGVCITFIKYFFLIAWLCLMLILLCLSVSILYIYCPLGCLQGDGRARENIKLQFLVWIQTKEIKCLYSSNIRMLSLYLLFYFFYVYFFVCVLFYIYLRALYECVPHWIATEWTGVSSGVRGDWVGLGGHSVPLNQSKQRCKVSGIFSALLQPILKSVIRHFPSKSSTHFQWFTRLITT